MADVGARVQSAYVWGLTTAGLAATVLGQMIAVLALGLGRVQASGNALAIDVIWQVHAAFASIGFAGLAIAFQVLGDPPLTAGSARQSVVSDLRFGQLLISGVSASIVIGITGLWLANPWTEAVAFVFVFVPSVLIVGIAYGRLAILFTSSQQIERLTLAELNQRVRKATKTASEQERVDSETEELIDSARGLVSGSLPSAPPLPIRRLRYPRYSGVISAVDIGPMVHAADHLAWVANQASVGDGMATYEYPHRISVRARPNREYRTGDTLFEVHDWPGVDEATWEAVTRRIFSGLTFSDDRSDDARVIFEADMSSLQDSVLAAIRDHQIARAKRGYTYYHQTIHEARTSTGTAHLGLRDPRWFERQIWEIDDAAARTSDRIAFVAIADAQRMANDAIKTEDLAWLRLASQRLQHIWTALLESQPTGAARARENLLVTMQNLAEFAIPYTLSSSGASEFASRQMIWAFASIARDAADVGDATMLARVLGYMGGLYDLGPRGMSKNLTVDIGVGQAVVLAWMLLSRDRVQADPTLPIRLDAFPRRNHLPDMILVLRAYDLYRDEAPWRHWETAEALPLRAQVLKFDTYFRQAALLLAADGKLRLRTASVVEDDQSLLQETADASAAVQDTWRESRSNDVRLSETLAGLRRLIEEIEEAQRQRLAASALSEARVRAFHESITETVLTAPRLRAFLRVRPLTEKSDGHGLVGRILGGLPREFFVETDVIAMPSDLGHQVGAAVLRDQDLAILDVLLADQQPTELFPKDLLGRVRALAEGFADPVLIYNGQPDIEQLLGVELSDEGAMMLGDLEAFAPYVGDAAFPGDLIVIDRQGIPDFGFEAEEKESLVPLEGASLSVGILESTEDAQGRPTLTIEYGQVMRWSTGHSDALQVKVVRPEGHAQGSDGPRDQ